MGKRSLLPPLGLLTVAALLPKDWEVRLCDLNVQALAPDELQWADAVFLSGMLVQRDSLLKLAAQARAAGKVVVVGGPVATTSPELLTPFADCVVSGEAEELMAPLCEALARGSDLPARMAAPRRPELRTLPSPRYDLLDVKAYHSLSVQWSRGCPFNCEFCDIIATRAPSRRRNCAANSMPSWPPGFAEPCSFPTTTWWATRWKPCAC
jgi:radical SAM superfamily enzyme YgiQ (UPF0313 family)